MKSAIKKIFVLAGCVLLFVTSMRAQRACLNLSETLWNITLDRSAVWQNDSLYVPPVNIHDLRGEFLEACGMTYEEIIRRVYNEPFANRFLASFAPFILDHIGCPEVRRMVLRSFGDFAERNPSR